MPYNFDNIPQHVAIIMDGNGRWAQNEGRERAYGHQTGVNSVREVVKVAAEIGVKYLTVYAFSTENWGRPSDEVDGLMQLISTTLTAEVEPLQKSGIKMHFIGNTSELPQSLQNEIEIARNTHVENLKLNLVIALNYSSRWEITDAVNRAIAKQNKAQNQHIQITEQEISDNIATQFMPDPDLMIRTSGEQRLSNFLLWQLSYTELYFTPTLWPEFGKNQFLEAIKEYNSRDRRFGKTK